MSACLDQLLILEPGFVSISNTDIDFIQSVLSLFRIPEFGKFLIARLCLKKILNSTTRGRNNFFKVFLKILKGFKIFKSEEKILKFSKI